MLSHEEIEKIKEQETVRLSLRNELSPPGKKGFWEIINSQFVLWLMGSVVLSGASFGWNYQNNKLEKEISAQREDSQFLLQLLPSITNPERNTRLRAVDVIKTRYPDDKVPSAIQRLMANIVTEASSVPSAQQPAETKRLIASAVTTLEKLTSPEQSVTDTIKQLPARVYLQIFSDGQREKAKEVQTGLGNQGFIAPGVENVSDKVKPIAETQVRYFNPQDQDNALRVRDVLSSKGISNSQVMQVPLKNKPKPGTIEVWFGKSV